MERKDLYTSLLITVAFETWMLQLMTGARLAMVVPLALLVVPALFAGLDVWHTYIEFMQRKLPWMDSAEERATVNRFMFRWLIVSIPPTIVLMLLQAVAPHQFQNVSGFEEIWPCALAICIVHGFINLPLMLRGENAMPEVCRAHIQ